MPEKREAMKRMVHALAALGAALVFGCSADEDPPAQTFDPTKLGGAWATERATGCWPADQDELGRFGAAPGYNADGCTRSERMAEVMPFTSGYGWRESGDTDEAELGAIEQPITVADGNAAGISINISVQGGRTLITGTNGACKHIPGWTVAQPIADRCIVPFKTRAILEECHNQCNGGKRFFSAAQK